MLSLHVAAQCLFGLDGVLNTLLYVPQILRTWKVPAGTSLLTWGFWSLTSADGVFYAIFGASNIELTLVFLGNLVGCALIFSIALVRRSLPLPLPG
ncbi:hypothetical protein A6O24_06005 [Acidithiobacillus thiooxidans]|nr:hypothetical protein A6O24_06005 [Acidithiobacillus thiooxidans]